MSNHVHILVCQYAKCDCRLWKLRCFNAFFFGICNICNHLCFRQSEFFLFKISSIENQIKSNLDLVLDKIENILQKKVKKLQHSKSCKMYLKYHQKSTNLNIGHSNQINLYYTSYYILVYLFNSVSQEQLRGNQQCVLKLTSRGIIRIL